MFKEQAPDPVNLVVWLYLQKNNSSICWVIFQKHSTVLHSHE